MVNVHTTIHGIDYILDVKVIRDVLETVPDALENVKVVQPPKIRNPRTKKVDYNEAESDEFDPDAFEDDFDPADYSDEISDEDDDPFLKQDDRVDLNNNLNDSCNRLRGLSVADGEDIIDLTATQPVTSNQNQTIIAQPVSPLILNRVASALV